MGSRRTRTMRMRWRLCPWRARQPLRWRGTRCSGTSTATAVSRGRVRWFGERLQEGRMGGWHVEWGVGRHSAYLVPASACSPECPTFPPCSPDCCPPSFPRSPPRRRAGAGGQRGAGGGAGQRTRQEGVSRQVSAYSLCCGLPIVCVREWVHLLAGCTRCLQCCPEPSVSPPLFPPPLQEAGFVAAQVRQRRVQGQAGGPRAAPGRGPAAPPGGGGWVDWLCLFARLVQWVWGGSAPA